MPLPRIAASHPERPAKRLAIDPGLLPLAHEQSLEGLEIG